MERDSAIKHELWDGEVFAMTGGTPAHAMLGANVIQGLCNALQAERCRVLSSDAKIYVPLSSGFVYPDASVVCGDAQTRGDTDDVLTNPTVVVEVLSEGTERFDRGRKFAGYRSIPSVCDYVLVSQHARLVEVYTRQDDGAWLMRAHDDELPSIVLPSIACSLRIEKIYEGVLEAASSSA